MSDQGRRAGTAGTGTLSQHAKHGRNRTQLGRGLHSTRDTPPPDFRLTEDLSGLDRREEVESVPTELDVVIDYIHVYTEKQQIDPSKGMATTTAGVDFLQKASI